ncbi:PKD domain-containing protein [Candidatus Microgenomates bacterium]|nr:PKD domain-containing protein [Candidatus Microgenomates bacterium]
MNYLKKNWLVVLIGCLSAVMGVLTLLTVIKLKKTTPIAPTVPQRKPEAVTEACTLTFTLTVEASASPTPTEVLISALSEMMAPTATPTTSLIAITSETINTTPTITPTSQPNEDPICTGLSANLTSGDAPLDIAFTGNGHDPDGKITAFEFTFGNGYDQTVEKDVEGSASHSLNYTYPEAGVYWASLRIRDNNDIWSEVPESCKVKIELDGPAVGGSAPTITPEALPVTSLATPTGEMITKQPIATSSPIPVPEVPEAGISLPTILTIISGSLLILFGVLL